MAKTSIRTISVMDYNTVDLKASVRSAPPKRLESRVHSNYTDPNAPGSLSDALLNSDHANCLDSVDY